MVRGLRSVNSALMNSLAPSTWANYNAAWSLWTVFLTSLGFPSSCISETLVLRFLDFLMQRNYSYSHIVKILAGISFFFKSRGFPPCSSFFLVKQSLKGYRKHSYRSDTRVPVTFSLLRRLMAASAFVCYSTAEALLFKVSFSLLFFGAFRISELLPRSSSSLGGLWFSDVSMGPDFIKIFLRFSKTDQLGRGRWIVIPRSFGSPVCAFFWLSAYLPSRPLGSPQLLLHDSGSPLTQRQFSAVLKKCLLYLNLPHLRVTSHSFRIGAATEAAKLGFSESDIKKLGGWKSDCYLSYIRPNLCFF